MTDAEEFSDLIGVPYKENGRDKNGFDCYGLVIEAEKRIGNKLDDVVYDCHEIRLARENERLLNVVPCEKIERGCILEMHASGQLHIGMAINEKEFIHCTINQGVRISKISMATIFKVFKVV